MRQLNLNKSKRETLRLCAIDAKIETLKFTFGNGYEYFKERELKIGKLSLPNKKDRDAIAPWGKLIISIFRLCERCHATQDYLDIEIPYSNADRWFKNCLINLIDDEIERQARSGQDEIYIWKDRVKCLKNITEYPPELIFKSEYNPFTGINEAGGYNDCALLLLIEASFTYMSMSKDFKVDYWTPFINAQKEIIEKLNSKYFQKVIFDYDKCRYSLSNRARKGKKLWFEL